VLQQALQTLFVVMTSAWCCHCVNLVDASHVPHVAANSVLLSVHVHPLLIIHVHCMHGIADVAINLKNGHNMQLSASAKAY
jgi:hypothetical protein